VVLPPRVAVGKVLPDVPAAGGSVERIAERVEEDIAVRVRFLPHRRRDLDPSEEEFPSRYQAVVVEAEARAQHGGE
jgi:hypothetical protein